LIKKVSELTPKIAPGQLSI